jgi:hypothetical protein
MLKVPPFFLFAHVFPRTCVASFVNIYSVYVQYSSVDAQNMNVLALEESCTLILLPVPKFR